MNNTTQSLQSLYQQKIASAAQELSANGYQVFIDPLKLDLPFDLGEYQPDLVAIKNDGGLVLDIKSTSKRSSIDRFQAIAEQVAAHQGWQFLLVTLDDINDKILPTNDQDLPSWEEVKLQLLHLNKLLQDTPLEPALLFFWSLLEAALRKRATTQNLPVWRFPTKELLKHLFASGDISISDFDLFNSCLQLRNQAAHGLRTSINPEILTSANCQMQSLVEKWSQEIA
jgi:REase_AHJR-like